MEKINEKKAAPADKKQEAPETPPVLETTTENDPFMGMLDGPETEAIQVPVNRPVMGKLTKLKQEPFKAPETGTERTKSIGFLKNLLGRNVSEESGLKELPEFLEGVFELVADGFRVAEDGKVNVADLFNFLDFKVYVNAFNGIGIMTRIELATATDEQIATAYETAKQRFEMKNKQVEFAVELIVGGILGAIRIVAVTREKIGS